MDAHFGMYSVVLSVWLQFLHDLTSTRMPSESCVGSLAEVCAHASVRVEAKWP